MSSPKIAIIGAGPAGLTFARILLQNQITNITIFEAEVSAAARTQGGSLDLHPRTGQRALQEGGLFEEFKKHARYESQDLIIVDESNKRFIEILDQDIERPEIDRRLLRQILLDSIPEGLIQWGAKVKSVDVDARSIELSSGSTVSGFDLIVGAEGAWSKVRQALSHVAPFYSGISGYEIILSTETLAQHPKVNALIGKGSFFALGGDGRCMLVQRQGDGGVKILAVASKRENWVAERGVDPEDMGAVRKVLLEEYAGWAPELRQLIELGDADYWYRPLYMLPVGIEWRHHPHATLIGDSAHLMTPFAGEGVNNAMADALSLARSIAKAVKGGGEDALAKAVLEYELEQGPRNAESAAKTWRNLQDRFLYADSAARMQRMIHKRMEMKKARDAEVNAKTEAAAGKSS